jgi:DNA-directed RNA polymerase specialized sigma24 family protein
MPQHLDPSITVTGSFPSTRWSLIVRAGALASSEDRAALTELCSLYWYPLYAFIRSKGNDPDRSLDLTQSFFARLLEKGVIARADRSKGRFRSFLRTDCQHFLVDNLRRERVRARVLKPVSIDRDFAENRYRHEPVDRMTPDRVFDRAWAMTLLDRVLEILADNYAASSRSDIFEKLKIVLTQGRDAVDTSALAVQLGMTEGVVNVAVHRLKNRYRKVLQELIAETLDDPSEIDDEIQSLFDAIRA